VLLATNFDHYANLAFKAAQPSAATSSPQSQPVDLLQKFAEYDAKFIKLEEELVEQRKINTEQRKTNIEQRKTITELDTKISNVSAESFVFHDRY
jgi:hypothetical protein